MQIVKIGKVFTIRWVSSSFRTVKAVLKDFPVLSRHFTVASDDSRTGAERTKYAGLLKHLTSTGFHWFPLDASRHIHQNIEVLSAMKFGVGVGGKTESKI